VPDHPDVTWWREQLEGVPAMLELPTDRPRRAFRSLEGGMASRVADRSLGPALQSLASAMGTDPATVALAGLFALLRRYTGQEDLVVGTGLAPLPGDGATLGPLGELVALRVAVGAGDSFRGVVERTAGAARRAGEHGAAAFLGATEALRPGSALPLFQVRFRGLTGDGLETVEILTGKAGYDLEVQFDASGEAPRLAATYSTDLFDAATVERLLSHWEVLLAGAAAGPDQPVAALPLLTEAERRTIFHQWSAPTAAFPLDRGVHELFEEQVDRTPDAPAVVFGGMTLSYYRLDQQASRLAGQLRAMGVGRGALVGLCVERSLDVAVGVLGILKTGAAYVPLDPEYPAPRLAWILKDTAASVVVTRSRLAGFLPAHPAGTLLLDALHDEGAADSGRVSVTVDPADLAYVIYTSGSTGRPKGVCLPHVALTNLIEWHYATMLRGAKTLQFASIGFDASFHEMFAAWRSGGVVHLVPDPVRRDVVRLGEFIAEHAIEKAILPVVVLQQLAEEYGDRPDVLASLREVTTTGEQMHLTAPVVELFKRLPGRALHNHYGPSETHVVTAYTLPDQPEGWVPHPPIGRPIPNTRALVLDPAMNLCPVGVPGELHVGGVCLAAGYLGRPDLTAERFVPDPFSPDPEARLYRTGDVCRWRPDGTIDYLGRRDDQVKIRGVRVELGEVESTISRHRAVREAVVVAREDRPGDRRLVAYVVGDRGAPEPLGDAELVAQLREALRRTLPEVMVPSAVVALPLLPLTPNGKVDKRALPAPEDVGAARTKPIVAPRSAIEAVLVSIWREVTGAEAISVHDSFFDVGGHSLAATQVFSRVRRLFGVDVTYQWLYEHPTVAALARWIRAKRSPSHHETRIQPARRDEDVPLSLAQERLWFLHRLAPESRAYSCPYAFRLRGPLDTAALERALDALIARHEALRTTFTEVDGRPRQVITGHGRIDLEHVDLSNLSPPERDWQFRQRLAAQVLRPFDLAHGPMLRAGVVRLAGDEWVFWLNVDHIVIDGWSMGVLMRELAVLYTAGGYESSAGLAVPALQFADYAAWERSDEHPDMAAMVDWWKATLAGAPPRLALPTDRPRPPVQSFSGGSVRLHLDAERTAGLRVLATEHGASLTMAVLTGFVAFLARYTGDDDLVVGLPVAGRDRVELESVVGLFVNILPIRVDASGDPTFTGLLDRVRRACLDAYDRDGVPFDRLVHELHPQRSLSHNPLVQVGFAPQPGGEHDLCLSGLDVSLVDVDAHKTIFDLTLYTWEEGQALDGLIEYSADLYDRATIERARGHLLALLAGLIDDPSQPISRVPILGAEERHQITGTWNETVASPGPDRLMHEVFERQAMRDPGRAAVVAGDFQMSYGVLERRASQLAHHLRAQGVGPEILVAVSCERSFELMVAVLGVLKAGGAFVPLDPNYPAERLAFMLDDCAASMVLTQAHLADRFADHAAVIRLDADWAEIGRQLEARPGAVNRPEDAAYVIYTSGSTGQPKGVLIEHRGAVNLAVAQRAVFGLTPDDVVLQFSALSFDAFVWELLQAWSAGATLCLLPPGLPVPSPEFSDILRRKRVSWVCLPPSLLAVLPVDSLPEFAHVVAGGEACSAEIVERWGRGRRFFNAYGPTEITVCATIAECRPGEGPPPIGRPLPNVTTYVLDGHGEPVPVGVAGELWIGGAGVGRGYLGRPELTGERFVRDRFSGNSTARLYRSGDRVRWRPDGQLEYLGRLDDQVKVRGFRIELGEVEAALRAHPEVSDAAVVARTDIVAGTDIVAYVIPAAGAVSDELRAEQVEAWRSLYDDAYQRPSEDGLLNITGWVSSSTGLPIPAEVMRVWRESTVERLAGLGPRRVWEIGCGTGLLLLPLAAGREHYLGTDLSAEGITRIQHQVDTLGLSQVSLQARVADDLEGLDGEVFDLVILNSVVQYFPDVTYLHDVLAGAIEHLSDGGVVFVGDVRNLALLEAFHTSVQLAQVGADTPAGGLRERIDQAVARDNELVLHPILFGALRERFPAVSHAEVWLKRGAAGDEMTGYRYDALVFTGELPPAVIVGVTWEWSVVGASLDGIERALSTSGADSVEVVDVPNARVAGAAAAWRRLDGLEGTAADVSALAQSETAGAVDPESLWELGTRLGYGVRVTYAASGDPAAVDVLFERDADPARPRPWARACPPLHAGRGSPANDPARARHQRQLAPALRAFAADRLPAFMVPSSVAVVDAFPTLPNGKVDRRALAARAARSPGRSASYAHPRSEVEQALAEIWRVVLGVDRVGIDDPFFELGGHSLLLAQVRSAVARRLATTLAMVDLFEHPTIRSLGELIAGSLGSTGERPLPGRVASARPGAELPSGAIAIVGMAGRFPGAASVEALWVNLVAGVEGITFSTPGELAAAGVDPALSNAENFVPAFGVLDDAYGFDAAFFGYSPREARLMDPQQRVFLECAFAALEDAAHDPDRSPARVAVFGGSDAPSYWLERVGSPNGQSVGEFEAGVANRADNLTSRVAYKLGLRGPAVTVLSACSTSLVAVHMACQSLRSGESDMALAGGVAVAPPSRLGHVHVEGAILARDGHCRPFDAGAGGTVGASGVAIVVLKRLDDARADGDTVHAVIRGSAVGNDGAERIGYTAPGLRGQADVIARAQAAAGVDPGSIGYIEAHGTGTRLGDPIEVAALTQVFRAGSDRRGFCALGSVKSNVGHLGAAAGVTGLIKAALALERGQIPPTLHFRTPNPECRLDDSPFFVNTEPVEWRGGDGPRRAGVSAFGVGGTSAHVVLEEPPPPEPRPVPSRPWRALALSARTPGALVDRASQLAEYLRGRPELALADVAHTLAQRPALSPARSVVVARDGQGAAAGLGTLDGPGVVRGTVGGRPPKLVFVFPGVGGQHVGMGRGLYAEMPLFREHLDACADRFATELGEDIRELIFASGSGAEAAAERLRGPSRCMAAIFAVEHALTQLLVAWGLTPAALFGHSLGEYAAASLAGVMSLDDAVALVAERGRLCDEQPDAAMLSVPLPEADLAAWLDSDLSLAVVNGSAACVVAGPEGAVERLAGRLGAAGVESRRLAIATAPHSSLMDPLAPRLVARAQGATLRPPEVPVVSGVSGTWLGAEAATAEYWGRHLRSTVQFDAALATLLADPDHAFVEVGPGGQLAGLIRRHPDAGPDRIVISAMANPRAGREESEALLLAVGRLWCAGLEISADAPTGRPRYRRVPLPTYPFERTRYLLDRPGGHRPESAALVVPANSPSHPTAPAERSQPHLYADPVAGAVAGIWSEVLGVHPVRPADNFFDLGGSSLIAIEVRARILERLGAPVPVHALVEYPTVATLTEEVRRHLAELQPRATAGTPAGAGVPTLLVRLKAGQEEAPPLFLVQPIGGTVYTYLPLVRRLAWAGPVYGLRASGLEPGEAVLHNLGDIAARYLEEIVAAHPAGLVSLGGYSAGGVIAYEMARQLRAAARPVHLVMIDAPSVPALAAQEVEIKTADDILRELAVFRGEAPAAYEALAVAVAELPALGDVMVGMAEAVRHYDPLPSDSDVLYIAARCQLDPRDTHAGMYWMDLCEGDFSLHTSPGDHLTMMEEPHVGPLARLMRSLKASA
jgi:amino acid adenylation domain-containing protein